MKSILVLMLLLCGTFMAEAQVTVPSTSKFTAPPAIGDVDSTSSAITDKLTSKLALDGTQRNGVFDAVKGFLGEKSGILDLAKTDQAGYTSKFSGLQKGFFGKLKAIIGATKYANFLKLKPKAGSTGDVLSNLFY